MSLSTRNVADFDGPEPIAQFLPVAPQPSTETPVARTFGESKLMRPHLPDKPDLARLFRKTNNAG